MNSSRRITSFTKRRLFGWVVIVFAAIGYGYGAERPQTSSNSNQLPLPPQRVLLDQYCVTCHSEKLKTAGLMLDKMDLTRAGEDAEVWEKVIHKLRAGAMPPAGRPRPNKADSDTFASWLEAEIDRSAAAKPKPGNPAIHRLNRAEYANAVRDLLALDIDAVDVKSFLPADDAGYGFDNIGDVLSVSPLLLETYMVAAQRISRLAVGDPNIPSRLEEYDLPKGLVQSERASEDLPFGSRGGIAIHHFFPLDADYVIKVRLLKSNDGNVVQGLTEERQIDVRVDGQRMKLFKIGGGNTQSDPAVDGELEVRFPAKAGARVIGISFVKDTLAPEGGRQQTGSISAVSILGPYNATGPGETPSRHKIFVCQPEANGEEPCAMRILSTLARRAYRRPITAKDVTPLMGLYTSGRSRGGFEAGIEIALRGILVSPGFLFRVERDPANVAPDTVYRISDIELASRLSFFLWSSIPDDALLELAEAGKLGTPSILEQQIHRMLADPRSKALVENFAGQWLYLRNMRSVLPDPAEFPEFDENLRQAMLKETELFFESMLREDRSVLSLLNADYTFLNERLARHYQISDVYGSDFRRVTLTNPARMGLLGQASILTVTSYPTRTSPTLRGKWLLENILGSPPPPPPDNVPSLKEDKESKVLSMRERMEQHRANPVCASCHARMDPMGFALENLDAIGRFRTNNAADGSAIDSSGTLPDGRSFHGPAELQKLLLADRDQFVRNVVEKLLTYALGRGAEYYDAPAVRTITREAALNDYRWSSLISGIVKSMPFQMRRSVTP